MVKKKKEKKKKKKLAETKWVSFVPLAGESGGRCFAYTYLPGPCSYQSKLGPLQSTPDRVASRKACEKEREGKAGKKRKEKKHGTASLACLVLACIETLPLFTPPCAEKIFGLTNES